MQSGQKKLSVCMITYNHAGYIAQAIESVINQKVNFSFDIIIGEDFSTDETREICIDYQKKFPDIIKLQLNDNNLGIIRNFVQTLNSCTGKYIAICEGDDYWTDQYKLQKQIDFLESHSSYSASAHQSQVIHNKSNKKSHLFSGIQEDRDFITKNLIGQRKFHTASFVFRAKILHKTQDMPLQLTSGDRALFLLCASQGPIRFLSDTMCVYRKNDTGISSRINVALLKKDFNVIPWINKINPSFPSNRYRAYIHKTIIEYPENVTFFPLLKHYFLHTWYSFCYFPENINEMKGSLRIFIRQLNKNFKNA